jgi:hypothetical protein
MHRTNWRGLRDAGTTRDDTTDLLTGVTAGVVSASVLFVAFGALALGVDWWWLAFPIGYGGVLPVSLGVARRRSGVRRRSRSGTAGQQSTRAGKAPGATDTDAETLAALRRRYAEGEMDDAAFERRVETLLRGDDATEGRGGESRTADR